MSLKIIQFIIIIILSIIPFGFIIFYVYKKDLHKEPKKLVLFVFLLGMLSALCNTFFSFFNNFSLANKSTTNMNIYELIIYSFLFVAFIEELFKFIFIYLSSYHFKEFDETYDILVYAITTHLGFAFFENIFYLADTLINYSNIQTFTTMIFRSLSAVPIHAVCGIYMGYFLSLAKIYKVADERYYMLINILYSIIIPIIIHGLYDFLLSYLANTNDVIFGFGIILYLVFIYFTGFMRVKKSANNNFNLKFNNKSCPKCLNKTIGSYCPNCGCKQV